MTRDKNENGLTEMEQRFCDEYLVDFMAGPAAQRAGYAEKSSRVSGYLLLRRPAVQAYINSKKKELSDFLQVTKEELIADLIKLKDDNFKTRPSQSIKAIETINKMLGYNEPDSIDITNNVPTDINVNIIRPKKDDE